MWRFLSTCRVALVVGPRMALPAATAAIKSPLGNIATQGGCSRSLVTLTSNKLQNAYIQPKLPLYNLQVTRNMNRNARRPKVSLYIQEY